MKRKDGIPFTRETERERWDYVDELETKLLRARTVFESVRDLEMLYASAIGSASPAADEEARQARIDLQARLHVFARWWKARG